MFKHSSRINSKRQAITLSFGVIPLCILTLMLRPQLTLSIFRKHLPEHSPLSVFTVLGMGLFRAFLLFMTFMVTITRYQRVKVERAPLGPRMCAEMCKLCYECNDLNYIYIREQLLCKLTEGSDNQAGFIHQAREPLAEIIRKRCAVTRTSEKGPILRFKKMYWVYKKVCGVSTPFVSSIAKSGICPNIVYFLLISGEKYALLSMHMKTKKKEAIFCYKKEKGCRQIFTGHCFGNRSQSCLYKLKVTTILEITAYTDQLNGTALELGVAARVKKYRAGQTACFVGKTNMFICLIRGRLQILYPGNKASIIKLWQLDPKFYRSTWTRDIVVNNAFSYVVIVNNKVVSLYSLNYSTMTLDLRKSSKVNVQTVTRENSLLVFHNFKFNTPFVRCSIEELMTDSCKSRIMKTYP